MATANFDKIFESGRPLAAAELNDLVENTKENKNNIDKKVDKETNEVQTINGGLNIGGTPSTASAKGRVMITGHTNPLIGLQAIDSEGQQLDPYYFQVSDNIMFLGTLSKALSFDRDGNVNIPTSLTVAGNSIPSTKDLNQKVSLPTINPNGTEGQFAVSDGNGGITWLTIPLAANETF